MRVDFEAGMVFMQRLLAHRGKRAYAADHLYPACPNWIKLSGLGR